ncbi:hypothetical protein GALMADRAFT_506107 [Galerina marginata CBS 339.88]|uniref:Zn(2)-C6 fungal-type domain-containing protein n=1 Tax=Galerina marginata (strain CBS 339.88) TaxID=685588 RepID=A0A067SY13_GALM3|nr:hypothetical protein GALMADRAFT_506107 [Galerina marginata CBS 339.88]
MPPTNESAPQAKKRKKDRACDACRRRKTKCDGPWMPNNLCSNCIQTRKPCTYVEASKPRGPPKAYVTGLEDRLEAFETLLQRIRPDVDFSEELGPPVQRNSWKKQDGPSTSSSSNSATRKSSFTSNALPPLATPFQAHRNQPSILNPVLSPAPLSTHLKFHSQRGKRPRDPALFAYRDAYDLSDEDSSSESSSSSSETEEIVITSLVGRTKITLRASENDDSAGDYNIRFHGRSSTAGLVEATRQFKFMHMRETMSPVEQENEASISPDNSIVAQTRRPVFWQTPTVMGTSS